jgi:hypothetical protein
VFLSLSLSLSGIHQSIWFRSQSRIWMRFLHCYDQ